MKPVYQRENLIVTEFDSEDVISTSGAVDPASPDNDAYERENAYRSFDDFNGPGSWF